ncbi:MAG: SH3 domain-containing protein [Anaerolineae bacterium]|nr:SH3 domain-containing protein [Anaerolineae bacterium]
MHLNISRIVILLSLMVSLAACGATEETNPEPVPLGGEPNAPAPTATIAPLEDASAAAGATVAATAPAVASEAEPEEAEAPTPSPTPEIMVQALTNLNLRAGPGTSYPVVGSFPADSDLLLVGRNEDSSWLVVENKSGESVWVTGDTDLVATETEAMAGLPVIEAPLLSYDTTNVDVNNLLNLVPLVLHNPNNFTCASHAGINNIIPLAEGNVIGPHSGDFVHKDLGNVLFKYSNGTLSLIRENPIDRFEGGLESLPLDTALQMFQRREVVWNGRFGEWPARGVTGCDESAAP